MENYRKTRYACYFGYITQAIINNLMPLLFIIFQQDYGLGYQQLGNLVLVNFITQLVVDILSIRFVDKLGYRPCMVAAHAFAAIGLVMLAVAGQVSGNIYPVIVLSVIIYAIGGGLLEVLVSPLVDALPMPEEQKAASMSLLHSFYCWGQVAVVLLSTLLLWVIGTSKWFFLPLLWALLPFCNLFQFLKIPIPEIVADKQNMSLLELLSRPIFFAFLLLMLCAGASELTISQWSSMFAEQGLGISKLWGDILGPCMFAVMMGIGRTVYGVWGSRIILSRFMQLSGVLCVLCYLAATLAPHPALNLAACAISGFSVSIMWPGTFSMASRAFPYGKTALFAILAMFGDLGCSLGPWLAGKIADQATGESAFLTGANTLLFDGASGLSVGILSGTVFPLILVVTLFIVSRLNNKEV